MWTRSAIEVNPGEILYFYKGKNGEEAYIALNHNGTIEYSGTKTLFIKNVGKLKEKTVVKNAADVTI